MTPLVPFAIVMQQMFAVVQTGSEFSRTMTHHALASSHTRQDAAIVGLALIVMIVTTVYTLWYLIRPGEAGEDHIKRRIIDEGYEESR